MASAPRELRRRTVLAGLAGLAGLASWPWAAGCGVVSRVERRHADDARRAGFTRVQVEHGDDRVAAWMHPGPGGVPVVLLHGFGGTSLYQWRHQMDVLARTRPVVVPDLLWFGESTSRDPDPTLKHQARAIDALLRDQGVASADVVGVSYGGFVALELARLASPRVRSLSLIDSPGPAWSRSRHDAMLRRFGVSRAADLFVPSEPEDIGVLLDLAISNPPHVPRFAARQVIDVYYEPNRAALVALLEHLEQHLDALVAEPLPATRPGLVIWGEDDPVFEAAVAPALAERMNVELVTLPGARHLSCVDAPQRCNQALSRFLSRLV